MDHNQNYRKPMLRNSVLAVLIALGGAVTFNVSSNAFALQSASAEKLIKTKAPLPTFKINPEDFFYAQQTSLWIFYKVPKDVIRRQIGGALDSLGFEIASFEDQNSGYLVLKPMVFMAEFGFQTATIPGTSASTEIEFTVLVYPKNGKPSSKGSFDDFLRGKINQSTIGQLRLDVLCDHEIAVSAGRKNFGEHKFLGSFEYNYPTPNQNIGGPKSFGMNMTASTWQGAGKPERKMFQLKVDLNGLTPTSSQFSPELLFSSFPPEPQSGIRQQAIGEYRYYNNSHFQAYAAAMTESKVELSYGEAQGAEPLKPAAPFGDGKAIPESENWPKEMVERIKNTLSEGSVAGYLLFRSPPAEYETKPFEIAN
jgi:hypothetical protein